MSNNIAVLMVSLSLFFTILYGVDKFTSDNPNDASLIRIGLSSIDSSNCKICEPNEIYYESGCKRCIQDGVILTAHVSNDRLYNLGWSNNKGMYYGDDKCDGLQNFKNTSTNENETYFIQISKSGLQLETNLYHDANFTDLKENVLIEMCSNPTNLNYLRISNEDGKPSGNGGKLSGYIDDIEIFTKHDETSSSLFSSSFNECLDKTCSGSWTFRNSERIYIDTETNVLSFFSEVSGTNDYAHLKLNQELSDSWEMRFKLHIDELEEHPRGKGILKLEPLLRQLLLGLPALVLPFISYGLTRNKKSSFIGILMISIGILIISGILFNQDSIFDYNAFTYQNIVIIVIAIAIIILGLLRTKIHTKRNI